MEHSWWNDSRVRVARGALWTHFPGRLPLFPCNQPGKWGVDSTLIAPRAVATTDLALCPP